MINNDADANAHVCVWLSGQYVFDLNKFVDNLPSKIMWVVLDDVLKNKLFEQLSNRGMMMMSNDSMGIMGLGILDLKTLAGFGCMRETN